MTRSAVLIPALLAAVAAFAPAPFAAAAMLVLLNVLPGRFVIELAGLAREWDRAGRWALSLVVSLSLMPLALNLCWCYTRAPVPLMVATTVLLTVLAAAAVAVQRRGTPASQPRAMFSSGGGRVWFAGLVVLLACATMLPYWPAEVRGHPAPAVIHDYIKHHAVLFSLERGPLPLHNPFYAAGPDDPVFYYHFFYLAPATLRAVVPAVSIDLAFGAQAAAVAIGVAALAWLFVRRLTGGEGPALLAALLSTAIGGLDVIGDLARGRLVITLDAWADPIVRLHNLLTQMVWTPQNMLGLLIILLGAYLLSVRGAWRGWFVLGPLLATSLVGSSVWVAFSGLLAVGLYVVIEAWARRNTPEAGLRYLGSALGIGLLSLSMSLPLLVGYAEMSRRHHKGLTLDWPRPDDALLGRLVEPGVLANLLDLPWRLLVEFGPLVVLPVLLPGRIWRRLWLDPGMRFLLLAAMLAIGGWVTVRSYFTYNDFGQKVMLVAFAAGALAAACVAEAEPLRVAWRNPLGLSFVPDGPLASRPRLRRSLIVGVLACGSAVGLYETPLNSMRRFAPTHGPLARLSHPWLMRAEAEGGALAYMRHALPADAVVQANWGKDRVDLQQLIDRRIGVMVLEADTEVFMPIDPVRHQATIDLLEAVLHYGVASVEDIPRSGASATGQPRRAAAALCWHVLRDLNITHVFVGTVERRLWRNADVLKDPRWFRCVYRDDQTAVYALRPEPQVPATSPTRTPSRAGVHR